MTFNTYKRACDLMEQRMRLTEARDAIDRIQPNMKMNVGDSYITVPLTGIADVSMLQMIKTMLAAHLETKLAALDAEFQALGGDTCESN